MIVLMTPEAFVAISQSQTPSLVCPPAVGHIKDTPFCRTRENLFCLAITPAERCLGWAYQPGQHVLYELHHPVPALCAGAQGRAVPLQAAGRHRRRQQPQADSCSQGALQGARHELQASDAVQFSYGESSAGSLILHQNPITSLSCLTLKFLWVKKRSL